MADEEDLIVTISGAALSMLLYENSRIHEQIGFFLGEVVVYVTKQVTDSDRDVETTRQHINVKNIVSYPIGAPFYNSIGELDEDKLRFFLKENVNKVVGWYHYRENHRIAITFRDTVLHQFMSKFFSASSKLVSDENFIFCMLTTSLSSNSGTHKFKQLFQRKKNGKFNPVTLRINNLGADASRPDGLDYKPVPHYFSSDSDDFQKVYSSIRSNLQKSSGVEAVTMIQKAAEHMLEKLIPEVTRTDQIVSELEHKLMVLRNDYFRLKFEKAQQKLSEQMKKMDVDDVQKEAPKESQDINSPESPDMFDPPEDLHNMVTPPRKLQKQENDSSPTSQTPTHKEKDSINISPQVVLEPLKLPTLTKSAGRHQRGMGRGSSLTLRQNLFDKEAGSS